MGQLSPGNVAETGGDGQRSRDGDRQRDGCLGDVSLPEAFALLGHEDRLAIVAAVVRARDVASREYPVPFSTLRDATGFRDTGRLAYHLGELTGRFLVRTSGGYAVDERGFDVLRVPLSQYADGR